MTNRRQSRQDVAEAIQAAVAAREAEEALERPSDRAQRSRQPALIVVMVLAVAAIGYIWIARPSFVFGPAPVPPSRAEAEASLRFALYLERRRVEQYVASRGRLPATLADAGPLERGIRYERRDNQFTLTGERDGLTLTLTSAMRADSFLGGSLDLLQRRAADQ
jgi:hypothetical protein